MRDCKRVYLLNKDKDGGVQMIELNVILMYGNNNQFRSSENNQLHIYIFVIALKGDKYKFCYC